MSARVVPPQGVFDTPQACVDAFDMARRETAKAWHTTALLSMVNPARVADLVQAFEQGRPEDLAECLSGIAGTSYDAYAVKAGIDGSKFMKMNKLLIQMLARDLKPASEGAAVLEQLDALYQGARRWIHEGRLPNAAAAVDLQRIDELIGGAPQGRLALLAPLSPAISAAEVVLKAQSTSYPFPRGL